MSRNLKLKVIGKVNLSVNAFGSVGDSERHEQDWSKSNFKVNMTVRST